MAGFYEGYLDGLKQLSGLRGMEQQQEINTLRLQEAQQEANSNRQEKDILANVFRQQANERTSVDMLSQQDRLAQQYARAGQAIMSVNPKNGLSLLREADTLRQKTQLAALEQVRAQSERDKYLGTVASNVGDQVSLDDAIRTFAKNGKTIPQKYQTWNEETANWFARQSRLGVGAHEAAKMEIEQRTIELKAEAEARRERREETREKTEASRERRLSMGMEARSRASVSKATSELKLRGEKDTQAEMLVLTDLDGSGGFKALPAGLKIEAAQDVRMRAQKIRADSLLGGEEPVSAEEALRLAREEVLGEISVEKGGWFSKDKASRAPGGGERKVAQAPAGEPPKPGEKPSELLDGKTKATALPVLTDDDYNRLPAGSYFMGPDKVLRRKP